MSVNQLTSFLEAMHGHDLTTMGAHLADDVTLRSPIVEEAFVGREAVLAVLGALLGVADEFDAIDVLTGADHFAVYLRIRVGETEVNGVDYLHLNDAGQVDEMTIMWRPLPGVVAIQNALAPGLGFPALSLVAR